MKNSMNQLIGRIAELCWKIQEKFQERQENADGAESVFTFAEWLYSCEEFKRLAAAMERLRRYCLASAVMKIAVILSVLGICNMAWAIENTLIGGIAGIGAAGAGFLTLAWLIKLPAYGKVYEEYFVPLLYLSVPDFQFSRAAIRWRRRRVSRDRLEDAYQDLYTCSRYDISRETGYLQIRDNEYKGYFKHIKRQHKKKQDNGKTVLKTVFDGIYFMLTRVADGSCSHKLNGANIYITGDSNLFSALAEDTTRQIYTSQRNFDFNSQRLNKELDCTITRKYINLDDSQLLVHDVVTPVFEDFLLFVLNRYGAFNLGLSDEDIHFGVSQDNSLYARWKRGELFKLRNTYRDKSFGIKMVRGSWYLGNLSFHKTFLSMELLYFIYMVKRKCDYGLDHGAISTEQQGEFEKYMNDSLEQKDQPYMQFRMETMQKYPIKQWYREYRQER